MSYLNVGILVFILVTIHTDLVIAQVSNNLQPIEDQDLIRRHYYTEVGSSGSFVKVFDENLSFCFKQQAHVSGQQQGRISDRHNRTVYTFGADYHFGMNYYTIDLSSLGYELFLGENYKLILGEKVMTFQLVEPVDKPLPEVDITINPLSVSCEDNEDATLVEYFGRVTSGNAPYRTTWFVFTDASKQILLNTPEEQFVEFEGEIGAISLDHQLSYTVVLTVLDACGQYVESTVNMVCGSGESDGVTVFLEETSGAAGSGTNQTE